MAGGWGNWRKRSVVKGLSKMSADDFKKKSVVSRPKGYHLTKEGQQEFCNECAKRGLPIPIPEHKPFLSIGRRHSIDYAFSHAGSKLALEIEGWGHKTSKRYAEDLWKYNQLSLHGWHLYRIKPKDLFKEETFLFIKQYFNL